MGFPRPHYKLLPIWLHTIVYIAAHMFGALLGTAIVFLLIFHADRMIAAGFPSGVLLGLVAVLFFPCPIGGLLLGAHLVRVYLPARCPRCKGKAWVEKGRSISYSCSECGGHHDTGITQGRPRF